MDLIEAELDNILIMIMRLPNGDKKNKLAEKYKQYRSEFENDPQNTTVNSSLGSEIVSFAARLELLYNINGNVDEFELNEIKSADFSIKKRVKSQDTKQLEDIFIKVLEENISIGNIDSLQSKIKEIKDEYKKIGSKNQELDEKIAQAEYTLTKNLLKDGRLDEAKELLNNFNTDMVIFLQKKLSPLVDELRESGRPQDALFVAKYCRGGELNEKSLEFWEKLINIEDPKLNYKLPITNNNSIEKKRLIPKTAKKNVFQRARERIKQVLSDAREQRESHAKVVRLHYDPKVDGGINERDYQKLKCIVKENKILELNRDKTVKIKVVFDEGITEINLPQTAHLLRESVCEVYVPSTATRIAPEAFEGCINLRHIDLSNTNVTDINGYTFSHSGITSIKFPKCLESINGYAFCHCKNLQQVDMANTDVRYISWHAFEDSGITSMKFSNCLKSIGEYAFRHCKNLQQVDMSNTSVTAIGEGAFEGTGITLAKFPDCFKKVNNFPFSHCEFLKRIVVSNEAVKGQFEGFNYAPCDIMTVAEVKARANEKIREAQKNTLKYAELGKKARAEKSNEIMHF